MKKTGKSAFFYALLILAIGTNVSFKTIAQKKIMDSKKSNIKVLSKEPILELGLKVKKFQIGEPVELTLTIKNETNFTIVLFDVVPERSFEITVKDAKGSSLPLTEIGQRKVYPNIIMGRESVHVESGKELILRRKVRLNELFDLKRAGNYTLKVKRTYYFQNANVMNEEKVLSSIEKFIIR